MMNTQLDELHKARTSLEEIAYFIRVLCALSFYGKSFKFVLVHCQDFPLLMTI